MIKINSDIDKKLKSWDGKTIPHSEWVKIQNKLDNQFQVYISPMENGDKISIQRHFFGDGSIRVINNAKYNFKTDKTLK